LWEFIEFLHLSHSSFSEASSGDHQWEIVFLFATAERVRQLLNREMALSTNDFDQSFNAIKCSKKSQTGGYSSNFRLMSTAQWRDAAGPKPHPTDRLDQRRVRYR
jgi:hypothetical protein